MQNINTLIVGIQLVFQISLFGQKPMVSVHRNRSDCWDSLKNKLYRSELACFTIEAGNHEKRDSLIAAHLTRFNLEKCSDSSLFLRSGTTKVELYAMPFDTNNTKAFTVVNNAAYKNYLLLIRDHPFWGTDGAFPRKKLKAIKTEFAKTQLVLPDSAFDDLYEPNFCFLKAKQTKAYCLTEAFYSKDRKRIYVYMLNGDGAGGYEVTFIIENKRYIGRVVDYGF